MRIDPLLTANPITGAVRYVTDDLLRETYLAPKPRDLDLVATLEGRNAPWNASYEAAPAETTRAIEAALTAVARSTQSLSPEEIDASALPECRAKTHLVALKDLWRDLGKLPEPLAAWARVISSEAKEALEPLPVLDPSQCRHADAAEAALVEALTLQHGVAPEVVLTRWRQRQPRGDGPVVGGYGTIQKHLGAATDQVERDPTVSCFGLRDPREEAQFASALAQRMLDDGRVDGPGEIGLLVPDDPAYVLALQECCERLGLPLSGTPEEAAKRDLTSELLSLLLILLSVPAPRTALSSLYASPLMPWTRDVGRQMAREVMDYGWSKTASELTGSAKELLEALQPSHTPDQLFARLGVVDKCLSDTNLQPRIAPLRAITRETLDWALLHKLAAPNQIGAIGHQRFVEGVSLFTENALPWRPVRQLLVLGMNGNRWPCSPGSDPFFTEAEIALIRQKTGLQLKGRREKLTRGLELFRRQLCAGTEGLTLLAPAKNLLGEPLSPSIGLALLSHMLGAEKPTDLVQDVRALPHDQWPVAQGVPQSLPQGGRAELPEDGMLQLNRGLGTSDKPGIDLLCVRHDDEGRMLPQSPSRLETLLVSPLAWLLDELDARDRTWAPETLDVMTLGTIIHQVLEDAFPENVPVLEAEALEAALPDILDAAIKKHARWLSGASWATERQSLLSEAFDVARTWAGFLSETGATILHNEIDLAGNHGGLLLHGKADCLLRLPDGRILVVDHKRSGAGNRRDRMSKGWDLQVALYRAMLEHPNEETALTRLVEDGAQIVTAYHTTRDATVLSDDLGTGLTRVEAASRDVSVNAMSHLAGAVAEVGAGTVRLNRESDAKRLEKERGIKAYALEGNPLVAAFTLPEEDQA
jgi:hypothetical protein